MKTHPGALALRAELSRNGKRRFAGKLSRDLTELQGAIRAADHVWGVRLVDPALRAAIATVNGDSADLIMSSIRPGRRVAVARMANDFTKLAVAVA